MKKERLRKGTSSTSNLKMPEAWYRFILLPIFVPSTKAAHWRFAFEKDLLILPREPKQKEILLLTLELHQFPQQQAHHRHTPEQLREEACKKSRPCLEQLHVSESSALHRGLQHKNHASGQCRAPPKLSAADTVYFTSLRCCILESISGALQATELCVWQNESPKYQINKTGQNQRLWNIPSKNCFSTNITTPFSPVSGAVGSHFSTLCP